MALHPNYVPFPRERVPAGGVIIEFPDRSPRDAAGLARDLKRVVDASAADVGESAATKVEKVNPEAQDVGTVLAIILGAKATVALAAGITAWMRRKNQGRLRVVRPDGTAVDVTNAESDDMAGILRAALGGK
jgi:hypothetical protein